jgi:pimeloyl-ACP methyl ester carboxylesterase
MTSSYSFRHVMEPLAKHHTLYVPDLPGAGRSSAPAARLHPEALAELLVALVDALGIRGALVVGNSMGGYLTLRAVLRDPGAFSAAIDVHSPGVPELRLWALRAALALPGGALLLDQLVARDPRRWVHRNVHYRDESLKSLEEADEYGTPLATRGGRACFTSYLRDTMDPFSMKRFVEDLAARRARGDAFPVPLALVYSTEDPMVPPRMGHALAELIPSAELSWMEDSSHFAHVDSPERFVAIAEAFFDRALPSGSGVAHQSTT